MGLVTTNADQYFRVAAKGWREHFPQLHLYSRENGLVIVPVDGYLGVDLAPTIIRQQLNGNHSEGR